jgi:hypothetical protein
MTPIPDVFAWSFSWLPYTCSDCASTRVVAIGEFPTKVTRKTSLSSVHRKIGAALGWYLLKHESDPTWVCSTCYGHRVIDSVMKSRVGQWDPRRVVDRAADWRTSMLAIGEVA